MNSRSESKYKGYQMIEFKLNGYQGYVILPEKPVKGYKWIWRTEFLGDFDQADMELVRLGWHLVYYKISNQYGSPDAVNLMAGFQEYIEKEFKLYHKTVLFGFSRGGLYAVNYAVAYPEKVASIYLDAPVIDMQSWPKVRSSKETWEECLRCYGFNEKTALTYSHNQLGRATILAKEKIPVLLVTGDCDGTVPYEENGAPFVARYRELSADIKVYIKKGCDHHPHSLSDVTPIVDFVTNSD
ncbi:MAG: alpha/beta hydrolase [Clostridia bacterium]|nr:alpha/beta hydrolase [Clostridia bacterium]